MTGGGTQDYAQRIKAIVSLAGEQTGVDLVVDIAMKVPLAPLSFFHSLIDKLVLYAKSKESACLA